MGKSGFEFGTIKTWFEHDAFGFVRRDADPDGDQVLVHVTQTGQRLPPGTRVSMTVIDAPRGLRGLNVEAVQGSDGPNPGAGLFEARRTAVRI